MAALSVSQKMLDEVSIIMSENNEHIEEAKSNVADCLTLENHQISDKNANISIKENSFEEPKNVILSNKERARKARVRKKKYYDDLEKRVEYLENRCQKLVKELDHCK